MYLKRSSKISKSAHPMDETTTPSALDIQSGSAVAGACHSDGIFVTADSFGFNFEGEVIDPNVTKLREVGSPAFILGAGCGLQSSWEMAFDMLENKVTRFKKSGKLLTGKDCAEEAVRFLKMLHKDAKKRRYKDKDPKRLIARVLVASYEGQQLPFPDSFHDVVFKEMVEEAIPLDEVIPFEGSYIDTLFKEMVDEVEQVKGKEIGMEFDPQSIFSSEEFKETRRPGLYVATEEHWESVPSCFLGHLTDQAQEYFEDNFDYRSEQNEAIRVLVNGMLDAFQSAGCGGDITMKYITKENKIRSVCSKKIQKIRKSLQQIRGDKAVKYRMNLSSKVEIDEQV